MAPARARAGAAGGRRPDADPGDARPGRSRWSPTSRSASRAARTSAWSGESGSGKSLLALSLIRLLPHGITATGSVRFDGRDLLALPEARDAAAARRADRHDLPGAGGGAEPGLHHREPDGGGDPRACKPAAPFQARDRAVELLGKVGIPDAGRRLRFYPHQLSGGLCQRVMIAMALAGGARLLIADEPTTSLDVTIQEEIVALIEGLARDDRHRGAVHQPRSRRGRAALPPHRGRLCRASSWSSARRPRCCARPRIPTRGRSCAACRTCARSASRIAASRAPRRSPGTWPAGCRFRARCDSAATGCEAPQLLWALRRRALRAVLEGGERRFGVPEGRPVREHRHPASGHPPADGGARPLGGLPAGLRPLRGGADGRLLRRRARPDAGAHRRVGLRQIHGRAGDLRARPGHGGQRSR